MRGSHALSKSRTPRQSFAKYSGFPPFDESSAAIFRTFNLMSTATRPLVLIQLHLDNSFAHLLCIFQISRVDVEEP